MGTFFLGHSHVGPHRVGIQKADVLRTRLFLEARFPHGDFSNIGSSHIHSIPLLQGGESTCMFWASYFVCLHLSCFKTWKTSQGT